MLKYNKVIEVLDFRGCNLSLEDMQSLNQALIESKNKNALREIRVSLNRFTEDQLDEKFKTIDDKDCEKNLILTLVKRPIESFYMGLFKCLKMY